MKLTRKHFMGVIAGLMVSGYAGAQTTHSLTAQECAAYAAKNSVEVKNALLDIQIQEQVNRGITAMALPNISGSASFTDNLTIATQLLPGEFFGQPAGSFIPVKFGTKYIANMGLELRQLLFDGQVFIGLKARKATLDFQQKKHEVTEEAIRTNIYKIYYQLAVSKTQVALLDSNISRLARLESDTRAIYKSGFAEKIDIDKINVQLVNLQTEKRKVLNQIETGYLGLKYLMGMPIKDSLVLTENITDDLLKSQVLAPEFQYADRKDYQLMELSKTLGEFNVRRYKLNYIPTLSFSLTHNENAQRQKFNFTKSGEPWFPATYYNLRLNVPIFSGFSRAALLKQTRIELQQTVNKIESLKLNIDQQVEAARLAFNSAIISMDFQKKNMALAESVFNQTKKKYEIGTGSNTEINAAQVDLVQAQTNYITALYDAIQARVDYLKATGKLE